MSFLRPSQPLPFPTYVFQSLPFRRRKPSTDSTTSTTSTDSSLSTISSPYLPSHTSYLRCIRCSTDLALTAAIISRGFTGRWGRAYLVSPTDPHALPSSPSAINNTAHTIPGTLPNTTTHRPVPRQLVTGAHTVSDISCNQCDSILGWKYIDAAEETQRYKVGKYILETKRVGVWTRWDGEDDGAWDGGAAEEEEEGQEVEFDSQDEEECEDLFLGIWNEEDVRRRRRARRGIGGQARGLVKGR